jgi:hypothetical protein
MTKHEKLEKAKVDHKYAIARIEELERELTKQRTIASDRLHSLRKLDPKTYGEIKKGYVDWYTLSRSE